jgi:hypothetical protein
MPEKPIPGGFQDDYSPQVSLPRHTHNLYLPPGFGSVPLNIGV